MSTFYNILGAIMFIASLILFGYGLYIIYKPLTILYAAYLLFKLGQTLLDDKI